MADDSPLPSSFDSDPEFFEEGRWHKLVRKIKEEPLIPFGCAVTCWALYSAAKNIRRGGDSNQTNRYFRYRLYAQAFTITAMLGGSLYYNADRFKRAEYQRLKKKQKEQEKRNKWIRELEARDAEDKEWRVRLGKIRDAEREIEDMRLLEEKRAQDRAAQARADGINDDNRGVIEAIRLRHNAAREKEGRMEEIEKRITGAVTVTERQAAAGKSVQTKAREREPEKEEFRPVLGESEAGGLFGIGHLKSLYQHLTRNKGDAGRKNSAE